MKIKLQPFWLKAVPAASEAPASPSEEPASEQVTEQQDVADEAPADEALPKSKL